VAPMLSTGGPEAADKAAAIRSFVARMWPRCGPSGPELGRRVRAEDEPGSRLAAMVTSSPGG